ncbi:putative SNase-like domain protein [Trachipleistophora hominis]|uniref:Putative SNase-like domain protein n=1 Tax=Trachipleistophora hominis TaxID=72359 RepID=L7JXM4_TRAHO|nr:putative SNase-like domain protein [Trachipleistophora hominis]
MYTLLLIAFIALPLLIAISALAKLLHKRFRPIQTNKQFKLNHTIHAIVTKVCDGDTIRVRHRPTWSCMRTTKRTILVRLYGIDAPECAHFGMPAQPYSKESTALLRKYVMGKKVYVTKLGTDRYDRCIGRVVVDGVDVSVMMVRMGMACVYVGYNAIYGRWYDKLVRCEKRAKKRALGMWKEGVELPMDYKRRMRNRNRRRVVL